MSKNTQKTELLHTLVEHVDMSAFDARPIIDAMGKMSFTARDLGRACDIFNKMLSDPDCAVILTLAGSTSAGGCMQIYADMIKYNMVDAIVATGASIVDMDFFEALGFKHYQGRVDADDSVLRDLYVNRIYDTYIDEEELQACDKTIKAIADNMPAKPTTSREFIYEMGRYLSQNAKKKDSLVELAFKHDVPIFCPAFTDSSAGFGLVLHQEARPSNCLTMDSIRDFRELTEIKIQCEKTGLLMVGGGVPKNFVQDTVVCAELLEKPVGMHQYAVQITVADARDGACSSSTLQEAHSWGKVNLTYEQMVFAEATSVIPLLASDAYHRGHWKNRKRLNLMKLFNK
jgi:deoxyhypusine synthase